MSGFQRFVLVGLTAAGFICAQAAQSDAAPFAYVANYGDPPSVSIIDLATETVVTTLDMPSGTDPYWVGISADQRVVVVSLHDNSDDRAVALINATTNTLMGIVDIPSANGEWEGVAVTSDGRTVYVADESNDTLWVIDVASQEVTEGPIDLNPDGGPGCGEPEFMLISPDDRFLYITCPGGSDNLVRVDTESNFVISEIDPDTDDAHGIALSRDGMLLYYSNGTDAFEYDTGTGTKTGTVFDDCDMYGGALSPDGSRLYCVEEGSSVKAYDTSTGELLEEVALGDCCAGGVAVHPNNTRVYVPVGGADAVEVVDAATLDNLDGNIPVGNRPDRGIVIGGSPASAAAAPALGWPALGALALVLAALGVGRSRTA